MLHFYTGYSAECIQCTQLIKHICFCLCRGNTQISSSEAHQIRKTRMCSYTNSRFLCHCQRISHNYRI